MYSLINKFTPNFLSDGIKNNRIIKKINFYKYIDNRYIILFFINYIYINQLFEINFFYKEFYIRNVEIICIIINTKKFILHRHSNINKMNILFFYDINRIIRYKYNLSINKNFKNTFFFIDKDKIIRYISIYNFNINNILNIIDKWQYSKKN
ncbi:MAG: redoxin domain-containing protein [Candidatus Shikimatogenerans bostrichidophilus]|nr:MAG: redoxin domain-containing protein [Candidatus Shikimatogenerans bostrichidophilus]